MKSCTDCAFILNEFSKLPCLSQKENQENEISSETVEVDPADLIDRLVKVKEEADELLDYLLNEECDQCEGCDILEDDDILDPEPCLPEDCETCGLSDICSSNDEIDFSWVDPKDFVGIGAEIGDLVAKKNQAYGDSFAKSEKFLELLYPNGVSPEQYGDMLGIVRVFDKMMRIATAKTALDENPWKDIVGYGILEVQRDEEDNGTE